MYRKRELMQSDRPDKELIVVIKPGPEATFESVVNIIDEMTINQIKTYFLSEATVEELNKYFYL